MKDSPDFNKKHVSYSDTNDFIDLIKELSVANTKLKLDLMNCKDQLSESKVQVITLTQKLEDLDNSSSSSPERLLLQDDLKSTLKRTTSVKENNSITTRKKPPAKATTLQYPPPVPTVSASLPTSSFEESPRHYHEKVLYLIILTLYIYKFLIICCYCSTYQKKQRLRQK